MGPPKHQPSPPFVSREFNGDVLLKELAELKQHRVELDELNEAIALLREMQGLRASEAAAQLKRMAHDELSATPALAQLVTRWAVKIRNELDLPQLVMHFERLAVVWTLVSALRSATERLSQGGRE